MNTLREPLLVLDSELRVVEANRSFYKTFKVPPAETTGTLVYDLGNGQWDIPPLRMLLEQVLPEMSSFDDYEVDHFFPGIGHKTMLLNARRVIREDLGSHLILLAIEDITDRKILNLEVAESEERFRRLFETAKDGLLLLDKKTGRILEANPAITELLGFAGEELIGKELGEFGLLGGREDFQEILRIATEFGFLRIDDIQVATKSGGGADADIYFVDRARLLQCNVRDIRERKRADSMLMEGKDNLRLILESIGEAIYGIDREERCTFCNPSMVRLLGYRHADDLIGKNSHDLIHHTRSDGTPYPAEECPIMGVFRTGEGRHVDDEFFWRADGTKFPAEYWSYPQVKGGEIVGAVVTFVDLTERRSLELQLRQSQKMEAVGRLAGGIAHDFNNLLTVITGYSELLLGQLAEKSPQHKEVEEIRQAGVRAAALTHQLLAFSRKQVLQPKVLDLNEVVSSMEKMLHRLIGEDAEFRTVLGTELGRVKADPGQIEQVLVNLVVNARDAMPGRGVLTIETSDVFLDEGYSRSHLTQRPGPYVMLAVSDTGVGMDEDTKSQIFEPFFTTKEKGKGTGLGLSTVYGIVKQSGGFIWVYSEPGEGSTFKVYLPRTEDRKDVRDEAVSTVENLRGKKTVLVVEDDESIRSLVVKILGQYGYAILQAGDGEEALRIAGAHEGEISLLVTDVVMPIMGGKDLFERLRHLRPGIRILYMSGYTDNAIVLQGVKESGIAFLQKPFSPLSLARKVKKVLDGK